MELAEVMRSGLLGRGQATGSDTGGGMSLQGVDTVHRVRANDEEAQREESSSTESTHQEVTNTFTHTCKVEYKCVSFYCDKVQNRPQCEELLASQEEVYLEEERSRIVSRVDDLKHRVGELEQQLQETNQEVSTHIWPHKHTIQRHFVC